MDNNLKTPPHWLEKLLVIFCKKEVYEILQGDLYELYRRNVQNVGKGKANLLYLRDAMTILRPGLIKKLEGNANLNGYGLFKNHLKTSMRNVRRNAMFSTINIVGLAISMSVGIMMIVFLSELYAVDSFHENKDRISRVTTTRPGLMGNTIDHLATTSYFIADQIEAQIPEVEQLTVMSWRIEKDLKTKQKSLLLSGFYATPSLFEILSFDMVRGNPKTALEKPGAIVLTVSTAERLFGQQDPLGRHVETEDGSFSITGIVQDPPLNSYLNFEMLISMKSNNMINNDFRQNPQNTFENYVYLLLGEDADPNEIEEKLSHILSEYPEDLSFISHALEPMGSFLTGAALNANGPTFSAKKVDMMIALAVFVLLSACFNYTNLSLGRALRRFKEISVRKVTGASRIQLFLQFLTESILVSFLALIIGAGLFLLARPVLLEQLNFLLNNRPFFLLELTPICLFYFVVFALLTGCIAGFFPAFVLSKLKASLLFNGVSKIRLLSGINIRQALITLQFTLSIGLIMCAIIVYKQYLFTLNYDLGYDTENIINISVRGDYMDILENEYHKMPEVLGSSRSEAVLGIRGGQIGGAISEDFQDTVLYSCNYVGPDYLKMHNFNLLAGPGFFEASHDQTVKDIVIVNERFLTELNINTPDEAIGRKVRLRNRDNTIATIQGVVSDFVGMSLDFQMPEPFAFFPMRDGQAGTLGLKVATDNLLATMTQLESYYREHDAIHPFEASLYDDQISNTYKSLQSTYFIISLLAFLAISISTLGLLGIASYITETRMKEISVRKVLGASTSNLILLLSRGFTWMMLLAGIVAIPISWYMVDAHLLQAFLYRTSIGAWELSSGFLMVLLIGVFSIGFQINKVTAQNPAHLLRSE